MNSTNPLITLTTDFGLYDPFVGIMQGVMLKINPSLRFTHLTHEIEPCNILQAAYAIGTSYSFFPATTIHLIVVDPGVGSSRKSIMVESENHCFIAPDNGVLSMIFQNEDNLNIYELKPQKFLSGKISFTFHGRDVFSPAAALFSINRNPELLGHKIASYVKLDIPIPRKVNSNLFSGEIIYIDRFGNIVTNFSEQFIHQNVGKQKINIKIGSHLITKLKLYYSEASPKEVSALINSWNNLEIFLPSTSAAEFLNARVGDVLEMSIGT